MSEEDKPSVELMLREKMKTVENIVSSEVVPVHVTCSDGKFESRFSGMLVEWMARGNSAESFAVNLGVDMPTLQKWVDDYPDFKKARDIGELAELSYWEKLSKMVAEGVIKGNSSILAMVMKSRFSDKYMDKQHVEHSGNVVYNISTGIDRTKDVEADFREVRHVENLSEDEDLL